MGELDTGPATGGYVWGGGGRAEPGRPEDVPGLPVPPNGVCGRPAQICSLGVIAYFIIVAILLHLNIGSHCSSNVLIGFADSCKRARCAAMYDWCLRLISFVYEDMQGR